MPVQRKSVDYFCETPIEIGNNNESGSVWVIGSYKGDFVVVFVRKNSDNLTADNIKLKNLVKISRY